MKNIKIWVKPKAQDKRFGFEVTMYVAASKQPSHIEHQMNERIALAQR